MSWFLFNSSLCLLGKCKVTKLKFYILESWLVLVSMPAIFSHSFIICFPNLSICCYMKLVVCYAGPICTNYYFCIVSSNIQESITTASLFQQGNK